MSTTGLTEHHPPPEVTGQLRELFRERHRLLEIGEETVNQGLHVHSPLAFCLAALLGISAVHPAHPSKSIIVASLSINQVMITAAAKNGTVTALTARQPSPILSMRYR